MTGGKPNRWTSFHPEDNNTTTRLSAVEVARLAYEAGFPVEELVTAVAISRRESNWKPGIIGTVNPKSPDYGLWQISGLWHPELLDKYKWDDPLDNAKMAKIIFDKAKERHGKDMGWQPWHTWTSGNYRVYLNIAAEAVDQFLKEQTGERKEILERDKSYKVQDVSEVSQSKIDRAVSKDKDSESEGKSGRMFTAKFLKDAAERAVKTAAQTAIATITTSEALGVVDLDAAGILSVVGLSVVLSLLTSLASAGAGDKDSASLVKEKEH